LKTSAFQQLSNSKSVKLHSKTFAVKSLQLQKQLKIYAKAHATKQKPKENEKW